MNEQNKIRIGGMDYTLPFLQSLIDSIRDEHTTFAADMLKVWEDSQRDEMRKSESDLDVEQARQAERFARHEEETMRKSDD
jgi:hypothetical protein